MGLFKANARKHLTCRGILVGFNKPNVEGEGGG